MSRGFGIHSRAETMDKRNDTPEELAASGGTVKFTVTCPGYQSEVSFPVGTDPAEAFLPWFEMQLSYLARWRPGSTATINETIPLTQDGTPVTEADVERVTQAMIRDGKEHVRRPRSGRQ